MKLTQTGRDLMPSIEMLLDLSKQMESYYLDTEKMKGELTVAMPESLLSNKMQPVILKF